VAQKLLHEILTPLQHYVTCLEAKEEEEKTIQ